MRKTTKRQKVTSVVKIPKENVDRAGKEQNIIPLMLEIP
jgi:hypothetical protein